MLTDQEASLNSYKFTCVYVSDDQKFLSNIVIDDDITNLRRGEKLELGIFLLVKGKLLSEVGARTYISFGVLRICFH